MNNFTFFKIIFTSKGSQRLLHRQPALISTEDPQIPIIKLGREKCGYFKESLYQDFNKAWSLFLKDAHLVSYKNIEFVTLIRSDPDLFQINLVQVFIIIGGKVLSKAELVRESPMRDPVSMKRTMTVNKGEAAKRPMMKYESAQSKVPLKKILTVKKGAPSNYRETVAIGKQLNKDLVKVLETKPTAAVVTSLKKTPEFVKSQVPDDTTTSKISTSSTSIAVSQAVAMERKEKVNLKPTIYQELGPPLSSALDSELQDIMIKVWQQLPDDPSNKVEKYVVEKIRNEACDDLRNVIGLNITKRLLNINNSLYAKLIFEKRPEIENLMDFIKKYKLKAFKRISDESPIFAAQFSNYEDYDRVCKDRVVYCGEVRVNVKACYNYRTCPLNLKTHFIQQEKSTSNSDISSKESDVKLNNKVAQEVSKNKGNDKLQDESNVSINVSVKTDTSDETKSATSNETDIDVIKIEKDKINKSEQHKTNKSKISNSNVVVAQTKVKKRAEMLVNIEQTLKVENEEITKVNKSKSSNSQAQVAQTNIKKPKEIKSSSNQDEREKLDNVTPEVQVTQTNDSLQKVPRVKTEPTKDGKQKQNEIVEVKDVEESKTVNKYEAIRDIDILEMISEGIVLDECTGSDVE